MSANDELQAHTCEKMLQEYGNVANNVAQGNSQHLTEQWKNGKLKVGECYFIRLKSGKIIPQMYSFVCIDGKHHCTDFGLSYGNVKEVLAPVPSYDDWVYLHKARNDAHEIVESLTQENKQLRKWCEEFNALDVAKENQQLKELLSKCREKLDELDYGCEVWQGELTNFIEEIDEVLK